MNTCGEIQFLGVPYVACTVTFEALYPFEVVIILKGAGAQTLIN